jgi:uncharacterized membrane protein
MAIMYSRANVARHPIHPMLVAFPVTFYTTTLIGFVAYALSGNPFWWQVGLWSNGAGVLTAVLAGIPGFVDWFVGIPRKARARRIGLKHMALNLSALALFATNLLVQRNLWWVGRSSPLVPNSLAGHSLARAIEHTVLPHAGLAIALSGLGFLLTMAAGFLGWTLVQTHHVGIELTDEQRRLEAEVTGPARPLVQS